MTEHTAQIISDSIAGTALIELRNALIQQAIHYTQIRLQWRNISVDQRLEMNGRRTKAHNAFIDCCNILSRNMSKIGENINWREDLGTERRYIGDLACWIYAFENPNDICVETVRELALKAISAR